VTSTNNNVHGHPRARVLRLRGASDNKLLRVLIILLTVIDAGPHRGRNSTSPLPTPHVNGFGPGIP
jgi:hypothetical protein